MDKAMPGTIANMRAQISDMMEQAREAISAEQVQFSAGLCAHSAYQLTYVGIDGGSGKIAPVNFTQNNYSPKTLTPAETARQTRNILRQARLKGK